MKVMEPKCIYCGSGMKKDDRDYFRGSLKIWYLCEHCKASLIRETQESKKGLIIDYWHEN